MPTKHTETPTHCITIGCGNPALPGEKQCAQCLLQHPNAFTHCHHGACHNMAEDGSQFCKEHLLDELATRTVGGLPINPLDDLGNHKFPHVDELGRPYPPHLQPFKGE